ncbi:MAG TPA: membrane protein insertion efficiency factor YidD [Desulfuromonadales bacterium]|nr:membrane protein insertion efficiency factor YidD [Desulfuromonadales bacterium]
MRLIILVLLSFALWSAPAAGATWGPWEPPAAKAASSTGTSGDHNALTWGVRFFQRYISPVDGPRCPMYPTCSAYSLQALHRHGPFIGAMMTVDRLFHENDPEEHRSPVLKYGHRRYFDPVSNNDFWFARP